MKIKVEQINCNIFGAGLLLTDFLKQTLQQKGFILVEDNADIVISSSVAVTPAGQAAIGKGALLAGLGTALVYLFVRKK